MDYIIETVNLTKEFRLFKRREGLWGAVLDLFQRDYRILRAVDNLNLQVKRGEIIGFIGANGAGKSTTIKMLTGVLVPSSGRLLVNGFTPYQERERYVRQIGVVFGQRSQLWWDLAVIESLRLLGQLYRVPDSLLEKRIADFADRLSLSSFLHTPVRKLSLGQRMRSELAAALIHRPPLIFLDEPTIGLDVVAKNEIRRFLQEVNREDGTTIFLTTHDLGDIEALCQRVVIIDQGRKIYDGNLDNLRQQFGRERQLRIELEQPVAPIVWQEICGHLPVRWQAQDEGRIWNGSFVEQEVTTAAILQPILNRLPVLDIKIEETPIEEIVADIYRQGGLAL
ncbi:MULTISPECIES: ATP-binding cassette domain-containing protein [Carboxydocella]|uniref:ABC-2 type transport system ATP-binding protein n=2 Tax=Carboxydocella TaxID=178898 RepID=A0A1T4N6U6_9FIRM|nr:MULTISPECIES: ATP-binding cassette domain-containing protein [Carboxydocella]AVX20916.1 ABC-2 type transport system ATP-binding protein [Carboxydocella thermautotrophica]AVX31331.1 ABC-2 type transport system ATP-binding protein [Carboxydocella thermautotrophica]SJZ74578.1 ABC-2 type transport system ATP-binding protein [Carboxydocella sporoproducens DSM 16521]GAW29922.1 daunorubicin ABC transporter ATP-binding protein [Carboxydocella sp. ULO1]GAW30476.1 daunorubicin ABC transporter ATP-bin